MVKIIWTSKTSN